MGDSNVSPAGTQTPFVKYTPQEVAKHYGFPDNNGEGVTVGIFVWGGLGKIGINLKEIARHVKKKVGVKPNYQLQLIGDQTNNPCHLNGEAHMDSTIMGTYLSQADAINVYFCTGDTAHEAVDTAVAQGCSVTTCSFGLNPKWAGDFDQSLKNAAAQGVTTCFASGDDGSGSGHPTEAVAYPAGSPYALAVGGTFVPKATQEETVWWNFPSPDGHSSRKWWGSGGGVSKTHGVPDYQASINPTSFPVDGKTYTGRGVPDVAAFAQGNNGWNGTSASCPTFASLIARINSALLSDGGSTVGDIHDLIYNPPSGFVPFTSITTGNNIPPSGVGFPTQGYDAQAGWDACTGWGIPDGGQLLAMFKNQQGLT